MHKLCESGVDEAVRRAVKSGKPVMGICLGMQLLFERSYEYGEHPGLGLLEGEVVGMEGRLPKGLAIPHIGWNALRIKRPGGVLKYVEGGRLRLFRPQLLRGKLRREPDRHGGVRPGAHRRRAAGEPIRLPVPPRRRAARSASASCAPSANWRAETC